MKSIANYYRKGAYKPRIMSLDVYYYITYLAPNLEPLSLASSRALDYANRPWPLDQVLKDEINC